MSSILTVVRRRAPVLLTAIVITLLIPLLNQTSWFQVLEQRVFDRMLRAIPEAPTDDRVVIVAIDDRALERVGEWPWSRQILAEGLAAIGDFSPETILLDVEFSEESPLLIQRRQWNRIAEAYPDQVPRDMIDAVLVDRDTILADTIGALGTVHIPAVIEDRRELRVRRAIPSVRDAAAGEGFANQTIDADGVSRRADLVRRVGDHIMLQLGVEALGLRIAGDDLPGFDPRGRPLNSEITLEDETGDSFSIPLTAAGEFIVRWPRRSFSESFRLLSWTTLVEYQEAMADLEFNLRLMEDAGYVDDRARSVLQTADAAVDTLETARATGNPTLFGEYRRLRQAFVALAGGFLQGGAEQAIRDELAEIGGDDAPPEIAEQIAAIEEDVVSVFAATREVYQEVERLRSFLEREISDSVALIGYTATSTTNLGVTPFDAQFPNVGLHGAVISMMSSRSFLDTGGWVLSWIIGTVWMVAVAITVGRTAGRVSLVLAALGILLPVGAVALIFRATYFYIPVISLGLPVFFVANTVLAGNYVAALRDRRLIRSTFEHYLAPEVISELVEHPDRIGVGGSERELTALFTDIAGFSRISEILGTADIVTLLNEYLTEMSDVIIEHRGTIDKYEGDAIMAFFGAPIPSDTHAEQACRAAIQMKKVESLLNDRLVRSGVAPRPLITRIGVNTGSMIVGNLGTNRRLNYTVMGPAVNLAARLEGVNKQYGTAMCVSGSTYQHLPEGFLFRRMDRVRVQGIDDPVRLYELIGYAQESSAPLREALELFERGLAAFERWEWSEALSRFETVLRIYPDDGPARLFIERCRGFLEEEPRDTWDGVITLSEK
ncbi:MAG: CHASE2 domain-containing protein [Alkalispirochaeta sp.]